MATDLSLAKLANKVCTKANIKKLTQLQYTANLFCKHKMAEQLYNWHICLEFRLGKNSFVCKDITNNEALSRNEPDAVNARH